MRIIVTAGPTRQYIDQVRFITNDSSGRMGLALAEAAMEAGHDVTLIIGPCPAADDSPHGCNVIRFVTFDDLKQALHENFPNCDALLMAAAVGDFMPARVRKDKYSRSEGAIDLHLEPTEDILASLGGGKRANQVIVAFALETGADERMESAALVKLAAKGADYIVANAPDAMGAEESRACVLGKDGIIVPWARRTKIQIARKIVGFLHECPNV